MDNYYITMRSVTVAQRGEWALRAASIPCALGRTPRWMEERGCGYCLTLRREALARAVEALRAQNIPFSKIYHLPPGGTPEEVEV